LEDYSQYKDTVLDAQEKLAAIVKNLENSYSHLRSQQENIKSPSISVELSPTRPQASILQQALTSATIFVEDMTIENENDIEGSPSLDKSLSPTNTKTGVEDGEENDEEDWNLQCGICGLPRKNRFDLQEHHTSSHNLVSYPVPVYGCSFCPRISENYNALRLHIYRHLKEGRYKCNHCQTTFSLKNQLEKHEMGVGRVEVGKNYCCKICGETEQEKFLTKCMLSIHMKVKHSFEQMDESNNDSSMNDDNNDAVPKSLCHHHLGLQAHFQSSKRQQQQIIIVNLVKKILLRRRHRKIIRHQSY
jgi:hypothetical protein